MDYQPETLNFFRIDHLFSIENTLPSLLTTTVSSIKKKEKPYMKCLNF